MSQERYILESLDMLGMSESTPVTTPALVGEKLSKEQCPVSQEDKEYMARVPYSSAIGRLMWIGGQTRPDILFPVNQCARFMQNPGRPHWTAVKRIYRYLKGTSNVGLILRKPSDGLTVRVFTDADYGGCPDTGKSTSGVLVQFGGNLVSCFSNRQPTTAVSTFGAELSAVAEGVKEAIWIRSFCLDAKLCEFTYAIPMFCDNQASRQYTEDYQFHPRAKHITVKYHFVRENVASNIVILCPVTSADQIADILTKNLPKALFQKHAKALGTGTFPK